MDENTEPTIIGEKINEKKQEIAEKYEEMQVYHDTLILLSFLCIGIGIGALGVTNDIIQATHEWPEEASGVTAKWLKIAAAGFLGTNGLAALIRYRYSLSGT